MFLFLHHIVLSYLVILSRKPEWRKRIAVKIEILVFILVVVIIKCQQVKQNTRTPEKLHASTENMRFHFTF